MSWLYYLLEANLYLILFFAFYYLVLRRETWYQYNRAYLLVTSTLAFIIPFVQLGVLKPTSVVPAGQLHITQIAFDMVNTASPAVTSPSWTKEDYYLAAYLLIACCLLINLAVKIYKLIRLSQLNAYKKADKWKLIETDENRGAFSFFNYLFVSPEMALSETVIAHELVHIRQKHSWDIFYFEILKVINWFNPIAYLLQHSIKELHEFIADSELATDERKIDQYTDFLLGNAYGIHESQLTNNLFNKSLLKKRIMMLHQKRSGNSARLKYLLVLPLSAALLCASTLAWAKSYGWIDIAPKHSPSVKTLTHDVNGANKVKRLKVTQGSISAVTDKISVRESKNKTGIYTANNLTVQDEARLLKNYNIKVEVVEVDSSSITNLSEEMNFPIMVKPDDISGSRKDWINYSIDPARYTAKTLSNIAASFKIKGYQMDFKDYKDGNVPVLEISLRKLEASPNSATSASFSIDELKKKGHVIFLSANAKKNQIYVRSEKLVFFPKPKEIATEATNKSSKELTTQVNSAAKQEVKKEMDKAQDNVAQQPSNKLPPPAVLSPGFNTLAIYLAKNMHYPANEHDQKIVGNVVVELTINDKYKVTNVKVLNDARPAFANEVIRAAKKYADTVNRAAGTYVLGVQFNMSNEKMTRTWLPKDLYPEIGDKPNLAGMIEAVSFSKE